jgi:hypothetical protein
MEMNLSEVVKRFVLFKLRVRFSRIFSICCMLVFYACNSSPKNTEESLVRMSNLKDSISLEITSETENLVETENDFKCVRGIATPIIRKDYFPNTTFRLKADSITAVETVLFDNGDKLTISNWGCDYYILTFSFETSRFQKDTSDLKFWYQASASLLTSMLASFDAPIDIKRGLVFLESYYLRDEKHNYKNLKLGDEIEFDGNENRSFVTLDRVEQISSNKFGVIISFATGPL